jgi:hypothetical protein
MELRAAPAGRLLAPLAVLLPILATPVVAIYVLTLASPWAVIVIAGGLSALALGGHFTYGLRVTAVATIVSWTGAFVALPFWYGITVDTSLCGKTAAAGWGWLPPAAGALAFLVVGSWALRSYRLTWGMPLAVVAAFAFFLVLEALVPGTQGICET